MQHSINHKHKFLPYGLALRLKNIGFKEKTLFYWFPDPNVAIGKNFFILYKEDNPGRRGEPNVEHLVISGYFQNTICAPLWQEAIDWLESEHGIFITFQDDTHSEPKQWPSGFRFYVSRYGHCEIGLSEYYPNPRAAKEVAVIKAIEYLEKELAQ